jgi:hypothetical protein
VPSISDGDTLTVLFTRATNAPPVGTTSEVLSILQFSSPLFNATDEQLATGSYLTGRWTNGNRQLIITLLDTRGVSIIDTSLSRLRVNVTGVTDATGASSVVTAAEQSVLGTWGLSSTPRFLANGRGFEASNTGGQVSIGTGDSIYLRFNQPVGYHLVSIATKQDIDRVFNFSVPIGRCDPYCSLVCHGQHWIRGSPPALYPPPTDAVVC